MSLAGRHRQLDHRVPRWRQTVAKTWACRLRHATGLMACSNGRARTQCWARGGAQRGRGVRDAVEMARCRPRSARVGERERQALDPTLSPLAACQRLASALCPGWPRGSPVGPGGKGARSPNVKHRLPPAKALLDARNRSGANMAAGERRGDGRAGGACPQGCDRTRAARSLPLPLGSSGFTYRDRRDADHALAADGLDKKTSRR